MNTQTYDQGSDLIWTSQKTAILLGLMLLLRALFSWKIPLIDDEAYHWSWTQDLMLSYYDHPAMIAWLETLSLKIFGATYWGVRFPSTICYALTLWMGLRLARDLFGEIAALFAGLVFLWSPLWGFGGFVASPETPFMLFYVSAAWIFWQRVRTDSQRWSLPKTWLWLGLIMGLGLNSKFIIALLAPGFGILMMLEPDHRKDLFTRWPWLGFLIATILSSSIFLWNIQFNWPGFRYQFYERHTGAGFSGARWLEWFAAQNIFYSPVIWFLMIFVFFFSLRHVLIFKFSKSPEKTLSPHAANVSSTLPWRYLFCLTVPTVLVFSLQPLWADYKPHWPGAAHFLLVMGVGGLWAQGYSTPLKTWLVPRSRGLLIAILAFIIPLNLIIYTPFLGPWMPKLYRSLQELSLTSSFLKDPWSIRWDLSNEFYGWEELGSELKRVSRQLHAESGQKPFLAALRYETTAQTWWGTQEKIYSLSQAKSHYTVTQKARQELEIQLGKNALVVTTEKYQTNPMDSAHFDSCEPREFKTYRGDELARVFTIWTCLNFQGLK